MRLEHLTIRLMPGIRDAFTVEAKPGLNFIVGPNGAGKSTVCRAVRALLWPESETPTSLLLESRWALADGEAEAARESRAKTKWSRGEEAIDAPDLPGAGLARCYTIGLTDLFTEAATNTDRAFAAEVLRQMTGGFDLDRVAQTVFVSPTGGRESNEVKIRGNALDALEKARANLAGHEDELDELRTDLDQAKRAAGRLELLEREHDVRQAGAALKLAAQGLERYTGTAVEKLVGDELDVQSALDKQIADTSRQLEECSRHVREARRESEEADLPSHGVNDDELAEAKARAGEMGRLAQKLEERDESLAKAEAAAREAAAEIDCDWDLEALPRIEADAIREAAAQLQAASTHDREDKIFGALLHEPVLAVEAEKADPRALDRAIDELESWLAASRSPAQTALAATAIAGFLVVAAGGAATAFTLHWSGALFGGAGLVAALAAVLLVRSNARALTATRERFASGDVKAPARWSADAVARRVVEVRATRELCEGDRVRRAIRGQFEAKCKHLEEQRQELENERAALRERMGVAPDATALDVVEFVRLVDAYRGARRAGAEAHAAREKTHHELEKQKEALNAVLADHGYEPAVDAASAGARIDDLDRRNRKRDGARRTLDRELPRRDGLTTEIEKLRERRSAAFTRLGLEPGDTGELSRLLEQLDPFRSARQDHERTTLAFESACARRESSPLFSRHPEFADLDATDLERHIEEERERADQVSRLAGRIAVIEDNVEQASAGSDHAEARAALDRALGRLEDAREDALFAVAGRHLAGRTRDTYEQRSRPAVEEEASRLFQVFTHGAYQLRVQRGGDDRPRYRALETATRSGKTLEQLSDGTRAQLFLAARLAFAFGTERGEKPPLFLDEALSNSDPTRFGKIAESLQAITESDERQIFYLTSNPADVTAWNAARVATGRPEVAPFDLARARGVAAAATGPELDPPQLPAVPSARGLDAATYGERVLASRFDPRREPDETHLFHLLRGDLELLERLLRGNVTTVGAWRTYADGLRKTGEVDAADAGRLSAHADALEAFVAAWRIGRGRPVRRDTLESSDPVSDRFIDPVAALAAEVDGDAPRLIECLGSKEGGVKGFGPDKTRRLAESLEQSGHLDGRDPLDEAAVAARVIEALLPRLEAGVLTRESVVQLTHILWAAAS